VNALPADPPEASPAATPEALVDVGEIIEQHKPGGFVIRMMLVAWLVTFFDGFDQNVVAFAAPYLIERLGFSDAMMSHVFVSGIAGSLIGGLLFGFVGDVLGRRAAIILCSAMFGTLTIGLAFVTNYQEFIAVRFVNGLALGGAIPLIWALSIEYVPRRFRATAVTLIMLGYGLGVAVSGPLSVQLIPRFGWPSVFIFGGGASLLSVVLLYFALPESLRFLATRKNQDAAINRIVRKIAPEKADRPGTRYFLAGQEPTTTPSARGPASLFQGTLRLVTPLLWIGYAASSMTSYFFTTWGPLVFERIGLSREMSAYSSSLNSLCGAVGGVLLMRFTDRIGAVSLALMPAIAVPLLLIVGFADLPTATFVVMMASLMLFLGGSHYGVFSITGTFYPTTHRALGTGWASSMGKIGSILAPYLGGWLLASKLPVERSFAVLAICPAIFCVCMLTVGILERRGRVSPAA
jgi:AAHS family 4-hydroxybenzoate transporter-like MFS transporter